MIFATNNNDGKSENKKITCKYKEFSLAKNSSFYSVPVIATQRKFPFNRIDHCFLPIIFQKVEVGGGGGGGEARRGASRSVFGVRCFIA